MPFIVFVYEYHFATMKSNFFTAASATILGAATVLAVVEPTDPYRVSDSMAAVLAYNSSAYHYVCEIFRDILERCTFSLCLTCPSLPTSPETLCPSLCTVRAT